ncbi:MAG: YgjP-like metallopeptidase domain-containing protein [Candidatus Shapirobacteria bacterium]
MNQIILNNTIFTYEINRKSIRSIRLKLISSNSFSISCPIFTPDSSIKKFIESNSTWIFKHSKKIISQKKLLDLKTLLILDRPFQLSWIKTQKDSVIIFEDEQKIYANISILTESKAKKTLEKTLKIHALKLIKNELKHLSNMFGFEYNHVSARNQKSRFGSCSSRSNLNFNWQIIFFPTDKFRHILLHELTHLKIKNHSKTFWDQLTIYDENCKLNNLWLKKEGTNHFLL